MNKMDLKNQQVYISLNNTTTTVNNIPRKCDS